jgi:DNA-binding NarL/FixJ family response regulator
MIMPEMDGTRTFRAIKEIAPDSKVIICSGYSVEGKATALLKEGADAYLQKPFDISDLNEAITAIIGKSNSRA